MDNTDRTQSIAQQVRAVAAQRVCSAPAGRMVVAAVDIKHGRDGAFFAAHTPAVQGYDFFPNGSYIGFRNVWLND